MVRGTVNSFKRKKSWTPTLCLLHQVLCSKGKCSKAARPLGNISISTGGRHLQILLFSPSVVSSFLWPHGLQHARLPCPSPSPWVCSNSIGVAIQPSNPLSPTSPPALNLSQQLLLFQWAGPSHQVAKVLELQFQHPSFQWIFRIDTHFKGAMNGAFCLQWLNALGPHCWNYGGEEGGLLAASASPELVTRAESQVLPQTAVTQNLHCNTIPGWLSNTGKLSKCCHNDHSSQSKCIMPLMYVKLEI